MSHIFLGMGIDCGYGMLLRFGCRYAEELTYKLVHQSETNEYPAVMLLLTCHARIHLLPGEAAQPSSSWLHTSQDSKSNGILSANRKHTSPQSLRSYFD